jgi:glycosyltransferase involved in cell wall biosynthesis
MDSIKRPEIAPSSLSTETIYRQKQVAIVFPCYNEEPNLDELYSRTLAAIEPLSHFAFRFYFVDNASTDGTADKLRSIAQKDSRVCVILNARNFGHIRSPFHGILEARGDCVVMMASDLQDPPEMLGQFLSHWVAGAAMVLGQKTSSDESPVFYALRSLYYSVMRRISDVPLLEHVTGFGLYDRRVVEILRGFRDPYPYTRGMVAEIGLPYVVVPYHQPNRRRGVTKNNFATLFDMAMLAVTSYSKLPLRIATIFGFTLSSLSGSVAIFYLLAKLLFWDYLPAGYAPAVIGIFFLGSVQIFLIGLLGEYIGAILTQVRNRPLVIEKERTGQEDNSFPVTTR